MGNLYVTNSYNIDMSKVNVSTDINIDDKSKKADVYKAYIGSKEDAINLGKKIFSKVNSKIDESKNDEYDETIIFKDENED